MSDRLSVLVCRGCCCGTSKHPDVDHDAQIDTLRAHLPDELRARLFLVDCLGPCSRSNVVVVRRHGVRRWFGEVLDVEVTRALAEWVRAGADGLPPEVVAEREFHPGRPARARVERVSAEPVSLTPHR